MDGWSVTRRSLLAGTAATTLLQAGSGAAAVAKRSRGPKAPAIAFANHEIAAAAKATKTPEPQVSYQLDSKLGAEGYRISGAPSTALRITAGDVAGAMYAGLDVAEAIRLGTLALIADDKIHEPFVQKRGLKFNIPLDLRTPSYSDGSTSARANIPEVWTRSFWATFLDEMARDRYNVLTLWSLHPFPSMVKVPEFPDVALDDVWRSRKPLGPEPFEIRGLNAVPPEYLADHEIVKTITIDQKIAFWRDVMQMAQDRGVAVYVFTWNVFTYGVCGKYGIDDSITNPQTIAYMRASVRELVTTYPLLAGIGITAGENLPSGNAKITQEQWLWQAYGEGVRDALKKQPGRRVEMIHRFHETEGGEIERNWNGYPGYPETFTFSYKYSIAHMYSAVNPPFIVEALPYISERQKTWLTVRNDDIYSFRWGDPDFAREYILNMPPQDKLVGFYMGPDGYCWGRDFLDKATAGQDLGEARPLVMQKQWYSFNMWGRLAFDPTLPNAHFEAMLRARFPTVDANTLFAASSTSSKIIPQVSRCFWKDIDLTWLPEACAYTQEHGVRGTRFYTVVDFMNGAPMPGTDILSIRRWRYRLLNAQAVDGTTPLDCAAALTGLADTTDQLVDRIEARSRPAAGSELASTLGDYRALAHLGRYYAEKISGACDLALVDASGRPDQRASAVAHLTAALDSWKRYAAVRNGQYLPNFYNRIGWVDLEQLTASAAKDIDIAQSWVPGTLTFDPNAPESRWDKIIQKRVSRGIASGEGAARLAIVGPEPVGYDGSLKTRSRQSRQ